MMKIKAGLSLAVAAATATALTQDRVVITPSVALKLNLKSAAPLGLDFVEVFKWDHPSTYNRMRECSAMRGWSMNEDTQKILIGLHTNMWSTHFMSINDIHEVLNDICAKPFNNRYINERGGNIRNHPKIREGERKRENKKTLEDLEQSDADVKKLQKSEDFKKAVARERFIQDFTARSVQKDDIVFKNDFNRQQREDIKKREKEQQAREKKARRAEMAQIKAKKNGIFKKRTTGK